MGKEVKKEEGKNVYISEDGSRLGREERGSVDELLRTLNSTGIMNSQTVSARRSIAIDHRNLRS